MTGVKILARRLVHPRTMAQAIRALIRGLMRFLDWYRKWIAAADKAHLLAQGSTPRDRAAHDYWCMVRRRVAWAAVAGVAFAGFVAFQRAGRLGLLSLAGGVLFGFVLAGRTKGDPVLVPTDQVPIQPEINDITIRQIVASATMGIRPEDWQRIRVLDQGLTWDADRTWWTVRLELPGTLPGSSVEKARPGLLSGLGSGPSQLVVVVDPANEAIVTLSGTRIDPWAKPASPSPLVEMSSCSIWEPIPLAQDARGRRVCVSIVFTGWIIGAIPRRGKTNLARLLALAVAMDRHADLATWDLKGGGDWRMFEALSIESGFGHGDGVIERLLQFLKSVQDEVDRRSDIIADLSPAECPEGQLTPSIAERDDLDMRPLVIFIDEVHWAFQHRTHGRAIANAIEGLVKGGQYVGIWFVLATQRPDAASIPTAIRDVMGTRAALRCTTRQASETILGTEAYREGFNAATLPNRPGIAIIYGADDAAGLLEPGTFRIDRCDTPEVTAVAQRATTMRAEAGRIPQQRGAMAADEVPLLIAVREIQAEREFVSSAELLEALNDPRLAHLWMDGAPWTFGTLGAEMRRLKRPSSKRREIGGRMAYDARPPLPPRNVLRRDDNA